jgi:hypothetical protein
MVFLDKKCKTKNKNLIRYNNANRSTKTSPAQVYHILKLYNTNILVKDWTSLGDFPGWRVTAPTSDVIGFVQCSRAGTRAGNDNPG